MNHCIALLVLTGLFIISSRIHADQELLQQQRTARLETVFESLRMRDPGTLASCLTGLSEQEASALIQTISASWGDLAKLRATGERLPSHFDKGNMNPVARWGSKPTQTGVWMLLRSDDASNRWLRIGLLFASEESDARQLWAVEWRDEANPVTASHHEVTESTESAQGDHSKAQ